MIIYVESSAAAKLILEEPESDAMAAFLNGFALAGHSVVASTLVETELRRAATRGGAPQSAATETLSRLDIVDIERPTFTAAGLMPGQSLRSLDALHVATALAILADIFVSYDERQIEAAERAGFHVVSPA